MNFDAELDLFEEYPDSIDDEDELRKRIDRLCDAIDKERAND